MSTDKQKYEKAKSWIKNHSGCAQLSGNFQVSYRDLNDGSYEVICIKCGNKTIIH